MGICWSEPPVQYTPPQQTTVVRTYPSCKSCGSWIKQSGLDYCEACLQRNAMKVITPSAPPMQQYQYQQQYPQYTYAVQQQQQQQYPQYTYAVQQPQQAYYSPEQYPPQQYPPQQYRPQQQQQMSTATAIGTGFIVGALMEDILDPTD